MSAPILGPIHWATLLAPSLPSLTAIYSQALDLDADPLAPLPADEANRLGLPDLAGTRSAWLRRRDGTPILRLIEDRAAIDAGPPMLRDGWMALEYLVSGVDALVARLPAGFRVLGAPADLDVSPMIRAAQVLGPCGELWYLTEVRAAVPPFELPISGQDPAGLFIGVIRCADRARERAFWAEAGGGASWTFETRITVLNRALGRPLEERHPVAVVQLAGRALIEIDEVHDATGPAITGRPQGVWSLAIACTEARDRCWMSPAGARIEGVSAPPIP
jgi:hypothetical protein